MTNRKSSKNRYSSFSTERKNNKDDLLNSESTGFKRFSSLNISPNSVNMNNNYFLQKLSPPDFFTESNIANHYSKNTA